MRRIAISLSAILMFGCTEASTTAPGPQFELSEVSIRLLPEQINAHVYGSFAIPFGSDGPSVITSGAANFPGSPPAGAGTCENGLWINSKGKRTSGDMERPHPHCVTQNSVVEVVLEPISSCFTRFVSGAACDDGRGTVILALGDIKSRSYEIDQLVNERGDGFTQGKGLITGYAIDAATLGTTNRRVGWLTFDLSQYSSSRALFEDDCSLDDERGIPCLNQVIVADYKPFPVDGVGSFTSRVPGFLWFTPASTPYNYDGR